MRLAVGLCGIRNTIVGIQSLAFACWKTQGSLSCSHPQQITEKTGSADNVIRQYIRLQV